MKNIFTGLILFCIVLTSCKKDNKSGGTTNNKTLYKVTFGISGFSKQNIGFQTNSIKSKKTDALTTDSYPDTVMVPEIYYRVYDSAGNFIHEIDQKSTDTGFGTINDQLGPGTYTAVFIGAENQPESVEGDKSLSIVSPGNKLSTDYMYYFVQLGASGDYSNLFSETFFKKISFTVTTGAVGQNISMNRIVGQLIVNIQDAIPANATSIVLKINATSNTFDLGTALPEKPTTVISPTYTTLTSTNANLYTPIVAGATNYKMYNYILNTIAPFTVTITCNGDQGIIAQKVISNVSCTANHQTILTGNLFGGAGTGSTVKVGVDTTWGATTLNYSF